MKGRKNGRRDEMKMEGRRIGRRSGHGIKVKTRWKDVMRAGSEIWKSV